MSNVVNLSIEYFPNPSIGKALSLADIYVGVVDLDPKIVGNQKQISVLQENGTTVQVSQPISTSSGGVPLYNGSPVTILVDGAYSLRVDDSTGTQVYYVPQNVGVEAIESADSIADLRAITEAPVEGQVIVLLGYYAPGDGGDGHVYWDGASVAADNGATVIKATTIGTGRFIRLVENNTIPAEACGYITDYNSTTGAGTENGAILESALAIDEISTIVCPDGLALVNNLEIPIGKTVIGQHTSFISFLLGTIKPDGIEGTVWCTRELGTMVSSRPTNEVVRLNRDSLLSTVVIFHDGQNVPGPGWTPNDTPWAVRAGRFADNSRAVRAERASLNRVIPLGFTHAIEFQKGGEGGYIKDCTWQAFKIGLSLDNIHHIISVENAESYPYWSVDSNVTEYMQANYTSFEFGRVDGLKVTGGLFSIFSWKGVSFIPSRSTDFPGQPSFLFSIDQIYSDACVHGLTVETGITPVPLTGVIEKLYISRTSQIAELAAGEDYGIVIDGMSDFTIDNLLSGGAGFSRVGGHINVNINNTKLTINTLNLAQWDDGASGYPAINAPISSGRVILNSPVELIDDDAVNWYVTTDRIIIGSVTNEEGNIQTAKRRYMDAIPDLASRAVTIDTTDQQLKSWNPLKPLSEGYREFRTTAVVSGHAAATAFTIKSQFNTAITQTLTTTATGSTEYLVGDWETIAVYGPTYDIKFGGFLVNGTPGEASLTFFGLGIEYR